MKLICELNEDVKFLKENTESGKKNYFIEGPFLVSEEQNRNKRKYPRHIMEKEVNRYTKEYINENRAFGELGHPSGPSINLERVSHMITELKNDGNIWIGKAKIMETPYGLIVRNFLDSGAKLGVSSRGLGSLVENNGVLEVQSDFYLATAADIVADPSAPGAFVNGIMENYDYWLDTATGKYMQRTVESIHKEVKTMDRKKLEENKLRLLNAFLATL